MKYKSYREKRALEERRAFGDIKGFFTFIAYVLRFRLKELFLLLIVLLITIVVLQYMHFDFTVLRFGK